MCITPPQNLNVTAASSVNSHEDGPLSAVEDVSPQPSPSPAEFRDSDGDERKKEEPRGSGVRLHMFEHWQTDVSVEPYW